MAINQFQNDLILSSADLSVNRSADLPKIEIRYRMLPTFYSSKINRLGRRLKILYILNPSFMCLVNYPELGCSGSSICQECHLTVLFQYIQIDASKLQH